MMRQNFLYRLQFYIQLTFAYSCHCIKKRTAKRIFLFKMKQRFIKSFLVAKIYSKVALTLKDPSIFESCIEIKIELNFYFHTSL